MTKSLNTYVLRIDEPKSQSLLFKAADDDAEKHAVMLLVALGAHRVVRLRAVFTRWAGLHDLPRVRPHF